MVTMIGNEYDIKGLVKNLLYLEHDAIAAYDSCIERLDSRELASQISAFKEDHLRHSSIPGRLARNREDTSGFAGGGSRRSRSCVSQGVPRNPGNGDGPIAMPMERRLDIDGLRDYNLFIGIADALQRVPLAIPRLPALTTDVLAGIGRRTKGRCYYAPAFFVCRGQARRTFRNVPGIAPQLSHACAGTILRLISHCFPVASWQLARVGKSTRLARLRIGKGGTSQHRRTGHMCW
jgi:hypothetical protein